MEPKFLAPFFVFVFIKLSVKQNEWIGSETDKSTK